MDEPVLLDVTYRGKDRVEVILKDITGKLYTDRSFLPYFYLVPQVENAIAEIKKMRVRGKPPVDVLEEVKKDLKEMKKVLKVVVQHPSLVPEWREAVKPLGERREMDIPFVRRYMIDHGLKPFVSFDPETFLPGGKELPFEDIRVLAFDIETIGGDGIDMQKNPIIALSLYGKDFARVITWHDMPGENVQRVSSEAALIAAFIKAVEEYRPHIIVGYNSDGFDWPYLKARAEKFNIKLKFFNEPLKFVKRGQESAPKIFGLITVDIFAFVKNILSPYLKTESLDLNSVAMEILGEGKVEIGGARGIDRAWKEDTALLYEYSIQDSRLTYLLAMEFLPMLLELSRILSLPLFDVARMTPSQIVEWLLIKEAFNEKILVPNRPKQEEIARRRAMSYEGAFVKEPIKGLHAPIAVCDFRSLYPTIIIAHNISPDTINCGHEECREKNKSPAGTWFCIKEKGFLPKTLEKIFYERVALKKKLKTLEKSSREYKITDAKQKALKLILNSFYGYMGFPGARWYSIEAAASVTAWGRHYITKIMEAAEKFGFTVVYGDTDSVMLTGSFENFEEKVLEFLKWINAQLPDPMELELEGFYVRGLFVTKKRYALLARDGSIVVKGLEKVRRDWSPLAREAQEKVLRLILEGKTKEAKEYVEEIIKKLKRREIPMEKLVIKTQLTKPPELYEQMAPHVKVALDLKKMGKRVFPGMIIEYIVTPSGSSISEKAVWAEIARDYDPNYYIENQLLPAVSRILDAALKAKATKQKSLDAFF